MTDPVSGSPAVTPEAVERATRALRDLGWDGIGIEGDVADALAAAHPEPMVPRAAVIEWLRAGSSGNAISEQFEIEFPLDAHEGGRR